jgi:hypothetical protein
VQIDLRQSYVLPEALLESGCLAPATQQVRKVRLAGGTYGKSTFSVFVA